MTDIDNGQKIDDAWNEMMDRRDAEIERLRRMLQALWIAYQDDDNFRRVFADLERDYGVSLTGREPTP